MKGLALTSKGIEDISASEIKELIGAKSELKEGCIIFDFRNFQDLFLLCYKAQSVAKIIYLLDNFTFTDDPVRIFKKNIEKTSLKEWISDSFSVNVLRKGEHNFKSVDVGKSVSEIFQKNFKSKPLFKNAEISFFIYINKREFYFGVDFSGGDLSKRDYRIFLGSEELKPNIAYFMTRIAGYVPQEVMLDPFCKAGIIPIEAALFALNLSHNFYNKDKFLFLKIDKFKTFNFDDFFNELDKGSKEIELKINALDNTFNHIQAAKKNAKIAGVIKKINFSRLELEWLDTKYKRGGIDKIITFVPSISKHKDPKKIEKIYRELFHQAEFILKKKGKIVLVCKQGSELLKKQAQEFRFELHEERIVMQGKESLKISVFVKGGRL